MVTFLSVSVYTFAWLAERERGAISLQIYGHCSSLSLTTVTKGETASYEAHSEGLHCSLHYHSPRDCATKSYLTLFSRFEIGNRMLSIHLVSP